MRHVHCWQVSLVGLFENGTACTANLSRGKQIVTAAFAVDGSDDAVASRLVEAAFQNGDVAAAAAAADIFPDLTEMSDSGGTSDLGGT